MEIIPQSPPIRVNVTERDKDNEVVHKALGRIVAWQVKNDGDQLDMLVPIIWTSGYAHAIPYDGPHTDVDYYDAWE